MTSLIIVQEMLIGSISILVLANKITKNGITIGLSTCDTAVITKALEGKPPYNLDKKLPRGRWWGMHEIFHLFVLFGSFAHWWFIFKYLIYI